ncbi:protein phosphatase Slingshot homolog 2 isoform X2 [Microcaecilia unicolor]|uniref:protein-serine/threonine phosphatase n=1 Tax=Microcaecilia unicolor TaxID=1415580 RepID=A0A6P7ZLH2_9AMPH|nr:protein phosphatase Slingshot homolog 2 isoform X2 [Microcaecilia unicolor]
MIPYFSENAVISQNTINQLISESFLTVKGAALFLPRGNGSSTPRISHRRNKHAGDLQQHLQAMFTLLRPEDNIRLAVRLESTYVNRTRYMVVVSTNGRQDTEESVVLGMDFPCHDSSSCTMGLVLPLWSDTLIHLDGDGGFSVSTDNRVHIFKPVSVQAMWSALQSLHKACEVARLHNYYPGSLFLTWVSYYESHINSDQASVNEWNAMQDVQSYRSDSPVLFTDVPTERERTERLIKVKLREIMMQKDLENITSKEIRTELEIQMVCNLREFKEFMDNEMIVILGQMDSPTQIFDHVFLGSEWNASNLEDLQNRGVRYILNVTREIDNFFPGIFEYHNIRVYDEEATDLLAYWNDTYKFISKAKKHGAKCLVHCKMGVSRSASTVIAYAMKEYGWNLDRAFDYVKERRSVTKPNPSFMRQLEEYQGILLASKQRHNKLWRSHSDSDLSDHHEPVCKTGIELSKKDIMSSAEQLLDLKSMDAHHSFPSEAPMELLDQEDSFTRTDVCSKDRAHVEFTARGFHTGQLEDILNLNTMNGCLTGCCLDESRSFLDNCCTETEVLMTDEGHLQESTKMPDLTVDDLEQDALKMDMNCHLLPLEELASHLNDLSGSPDQDIPTSQPEPADLSMDRIDFFSALEKFVELSQESKSRICSHSRLEEQECGRNSTSKGSVHEVLSSEVARDVPRDSSESNTPYASQENTPGEEQSQEIIQGHFPISHSENAISVKEIITEIESINQGTGQCQQTTENLAFQSQTPKRNTILELPFEESWSSKTNNEKREISEGSEIVPHEKFTDYMEQEGIQILKCPGENIEENDETGQQHELLIQSSNPEPKWCPGSVRRATMEFEERLRQEHEQQQHTPLMGSLPTRKNSKNDGLAVEQTSKRTHDEPSFEPTLKETERDKKVQSPNIEPEDILPHSCDLAADAHILALGPHPVQAIQDYSLSEVSTRQGGILKELRTVVSPEASGRQVLPGQLPKRIEIIEYTHVVKPVDHKENDHHSPVITENTEDGLPQRVNVEKAVKAAVSPAVEYNDISECTDKSSVHPGIVILPDHSELRPEATFAIGNPQDEFCNPLVNLDTSPSKPDPNLTLTNLDCHHTLYVEGITEQCTCTDDDPVDVGSFSGSTDVAETFHRGSDSALNLLSNEDLTLISKLTETVRELHEVLDISSPLCGLPHSCSSDSIKDLISNRGVVKERAKEIEARIRQAGLTTPSRMKRSASIAKLGSLDLSKDDLSERELDSIETNQVFPDLVDSSFYSIPGVQEITSELQEKLCIVSVAQEPESKPTKYFVEQLKTAECVVQSKPVERPPVQYAKDCGSTQQSLFSNIESKLTNSEEHLSQLLDPLCSAPLVTITPQQLLGRTLPLKRIKKTLEREGNEKKRTTSPLYNTM